MKVIIFGCGRVGCELATKLDAAGHTVTVLDNSQLAFMKLPDTFKGQMLLGNGLEQEVLKRAGIEEADAFVALTQGDNRNIMASEIAQSIYHVKNVICRIYDPIRSEIFSKLGLTTISPTTTFSNLLADSLLQNATQEEVSE